MANLISAQDYTAYPTISPTERIAYGDDRQQFGDLYVPAGSGPFPVIILIHGGCWQAQYGLEPMGNACVDLVKAGFIVWSIEYRRIGSGGGWPSTFQDVGRAVDFVRTLSQRYPLDLTRIIVSGHSAGGHLACWVAGRKMIPASSEIAAIDPLPVSAVVSLAGIPDLAVAAARQICQSSPADLIGGMPDEVADRYAAGSPHALLPFGVPQVHINGTKDYVIPVDYITEFVATAQAAGDQVELQLIADIGHFEIVTPGTPAWDQVRAAMLSFGIRSV